MKALNFDRLRTFLAAADHLSFTRAGQSLHLSQPAISQQIRELEDDLDVALFERRGRQLVLTPAGEQLVPAAQRVLREVESLHRSMEPYRGVPQGSIRVGSSNTIGIYLLPQAIGRFTHENPGIRVTLQIEDVDTILRGMQNGDFDVALVDQDVTRGRLGGLNKEPLLEDELVVVASPDHPAARKGMLEAEELLNYPMIWRHPASPTRQMIHRTLSEAGIDPDAIPVAFELGNTEAIKRATMAGLGLGVVSRYAIARELAAHDLVVVPVRRVIIQRMLWLLRPTRELPPPQVLFCDFLLSGGLLSGAEAVR